MKKVYYTWSDVEGACLDIARQIQQSGFKPDYIVGLTRGGLAPAVLLSNYLDVPMETLKVQLRDGSTQESNCWMAEDAIGYIPLEERTANGGWATLPIKRKKILIVDDINDTGATIKWIKKDWREACMPDEFAWEDIWGDNVRVAVLTDNLSSAASVDYSVWEVNKAEDDCWLVYPWEEFWK